MYVCPRGAGGRGLDALPRHPIAHTIYFGHLAFMMNTLGASFLLCVIMNLFHSLSIYGVVYVEPWKRFSHKCVALITTSHYWWLLLQFYPLQGPKMADILALIQICEFSTLDYVWWWFPQLVHQWHGVYWVMKISHKCAALLTHVTLLVIAILPLSSQGPNWLISALKQMCGAILDYVWWWLFTACQFMAWCMLSHENIS